MQFEDVEGSIMIAVKHQSTGGQTWVRVERLLYTRSPQPEQSCVVKRGETATTGTRLSAHSSAASPGIAPTPHR